MRRLGLALVGGWMLACSGVMDDEAMDDVTEDDATEDDGDDDEDEEEVEAKDPLPDVEPDEDDREDDCMPETYEDADRLLSDDQSDGGEVEVDASKNRIVETVVMRNGLMVRVTRGGCAHAGETWEISPAPKGPVAKVFKRVLGFLERENEESGIDMCLEHIPDPPPKNGWAAGDANCSWSKEGEVLTVTYDFAI